ncbi:MULTISPECIES: DUF4262 domain-containing protein [unclassified Streptomyces]|uniref:DUF4262 domain-containing protein n=1 Tax=unclassified Streptomyces TaxID=2593676 RepID=UPI003825FCE5
MVPEDEIGPGFAYTIGLAHTHGGPELAMFGLDVHAMHRMLNTLGEKSAAGESARGRLVDPAAGLPCGVSARPAGMRGQLGGLALQLAVQSALQLALQRVLQRAFQLAPGRLAGWSGEHAAGWLARRLARSFIPAGGWSTSVVKGPDRRRLFRTTPSGAPGLRIRRPFARAAARRQQCPGVHGARSRSVASIRGLGVDSVILVVLVVGPTTPRAARHGVAEGPSVWTGPQSCAGRGR